MTINTQKRSQQVQELLQKFEHRIVGQNEAIDAIVNVLERYLAGLNDPTRPIGTLLFLGPTGTGKTATVEALCEGLYGHDTSMIKIDCGEFIHDHEIAKLVGSPPGYLGHASTPARFNQTSIKNLQTPDVPFTVILFDEVEKACDELWHLMLGILDKGVLTLGDNSTVKFNDTLILMTSNVGARQLAESAGGDGVIGFSAPNAESLTQSEATDISMSAARAKFTPEFLNRMDEIVTFNTLTKEQIELVMDKELQKIRTRLMLKHVISIDISPAAKKEIFARGYDKRYNARGIRRSLEKALLCPIGRAISCGEIKSSDDVVVDFARGEFTFQHAVKAKVVSRWP